MAVRAIDRGTVKSDGLPVDVVAADLRSAEEAALALEGCTEIVHLAALPTPDSAGPAALWNANVSMCGNVLLAARNERLSQIVVASSQSALGLPYAKAVESPDYLPVDEEHPLRPTDAYSASKAATEVLAAAVGRAGPAGVRCLRFPVIWHPNRHEEHVRRRLDNPEQSPKSLWAYIDVRDAARAVRLALGSPIAGYECLNITSRVPFASVATPDLAANWFPDVSDIRIPLEADTALFDWRRAADRLGFRSRYRWTENGIRDLDGGSPPAG
jgi:nucleoside-diphosphate-sugar epimerase